MHTHIHTHTHTHLDLSASAHGTAGESVRLPAAAAAGLCVVPHRVTLSLWARMVVQVWACNNHSTSPGLTCNPIPNSGVKTCTDGHTRVCMCMRFVSVVVCGERRTILRAERASVPIRAACTRVRANPHIHTHLARIRGRHRCDPVRIDNGTLRTSGGVRPSSRSSPCELPRKPRSSFQAARPEPELHPQLHPPPSPAAQLQAQGAHH
jgi:hypothetical protein